VPAKATTNNPTNSSIALTRASFDHLIGTSEERGAIGGVAGAIEIVAATADTWLTVDKMLKGAKRADSL